MAKKDLFWFCKFGLNEQGSFSLEFHVVPMSYLNGQGVRPVLAGSNWLSYSFYESLLNVKTPYRESFKEYLITLQRVTVPTIRLQ